MVYYRRNRVAGGTYFFMVTLRDRSSDSLVRHVGLLRGAFREVRTERPFTIDAIVILPDHLHAIWTLPEGDADYSGRWRAIKSRFTRALRAYGIPLTLDDRGEYRLWQQVASMELRGIEEIETAKSPISLHFIEVTARFLCIASVK